MTHTQPLLSGQERWLLATIVGASDLEEASEWTNLSVRTLSRHLDTMRHRYKVDTTLQLVARATARGEIDPDKLLA